MNFLTKIKDFHLMRLYRLYSKATVEHKDKKSEIEVESVKRIRPFSKDMLLNRFNLDMLEFPEVYSNEYADQVLSVSKEVDKLMKARDMLDRNTMISRLSASGIMGVTLPGIFIEGRYNWMMLTRLLESIASDVDYTQNIYIPQTLVGQCFLYGGNEVQKEQYLKKISKGELKGCIAITEGLSDMVNDASFNTTATADIASNSWIINGRKTRVFHYLDSDIVVVFARTASDDIIPFIVDSKSVGVTSDTGGNNKSCVDLHFTNVKVPKENILQSQVGSEFPRYLSAINNVCTAAICSSITKSFVQLVNEFVSNRHIFGKPLSQFESTQAHIVNLTLYCYSTESVAYFTAGALDYQQDIDLFIESTITKMHSVECLRRCVDLSLKIVGTNYLSDPRFKSLHRDASTVLSNQSSTKLSGLDLAAESVKYMCQEFNTAKFDPFRKIVDFVGQYKIRGILEEKYVANSFKYNLHPRVGKLADNIYAEYFQLSKILRKLSKRPELLSENFCAEKLSNILSDSFVLMAVLSRASRSIAIGLRNHDHEVRLAEALCRNIGAEIKKNVDCLRSYPSNIDEFKTVVGSLDVEGSHFEMMKKEQ